MLIMTLADAVAADHHSYYHFGLKKQYEELQNLVPEVPKNIIDGYRKVVAAANKIDAACLAQFYFVQFITQNGGHIKKYDSFEQFEAAKL